MLDISASKNYTIVISENKDCFKRNFISEQNVGPVQLCPVSLQVIDWKWKFQLTSLLCKNDFQRVRWQVRSWWWTLLRLEFSTLQHLTRIQVFFKLQKGLGSIHLICNLSHLSMEILIERIYHYSEINDKSKSLRQVLSI